jgi:uncharacterized protein with von Willebrand factor type A (vWA) domain
MRALIYDVLRGRPTQGASTITQQIVKNLLLTPERTVARKVRELILARRLEQELGKEQILFLYLNHINFGHGRYGVEEASRFYFGKHVEELDLDETISKTAANAGYLDIKMRPERHNNVKVLLLMDVGGTMDEHIARVEELFSAVKTELKHLEFYYFHNCVYDFMWKNNKRRFSEKFATHDILRKYNKDYKLIFVGDATMSPYEILQPGGSVEYNNEEAGAEWLQRLTHAFPKFAWINPEPQGVWQYRQSIAVIQQLMSHRMYPLTLRGLEDAMRTLSK